MLPLVLVAPRRLPRKVHHWQVILPEELKDTTYLMKEAISGHQRSSELKDTTYLMKEAISGHQRSSEAIRGLKKR